MKQLWKDIISLVHSAGIHYWKVNDLDRKEITRTCKYCHKKQGLTEIYPNTIHQSPILLWEDID